MKKQAVIGCGFGDEGKGKVVSYLCSQYKNPLIIRYCGGQQAGHHVVLRNGLDHVCSNFGSGTLQGFDTYWSRFCTIDPIAILNELDVLKAKGIFPTLYINEHCPITTPYESRYNQHVEKDNQHGSCGVGVGQTIQREEDHHSILAFDLLHISVLKMKFDLLREYYINKGGISNFLSIMRREKFIDACQELVDCSFIKIIKGLSLTTRPYDNFIFEGSQGLLLDQEIGFFPHVTRGYTGTRNILKMRFSPEIFLVTRAYQTRHGNGPMTNGDYPHSILQNPYELNSDTGFQGRFRKNLLDLDLLKYAIDRDENLRELSISLVITCLDLIQNDYSFTVNGQIRRYDCERDFVRAIKDELRISKVYLSRNPFPELELFQ